MTRQGAVPVSRESTVALAPKQQAMSKSQKFILGVDIGGTKVEAGLVGSSGAVLLSARSPMIARGNADEGLTAVCLAIDGVLRDPRAKTVGTIGVSVPGWVDSRRGTVVSATNLPCWWNGQRRKRCRASRIDVGRRRGLRKYVLRFTRDRHRRGHGASRRALRRYHWSGRRRRTHDDRPLRPEVWMWQARLH